MVELVTSAAMVAVLSLGVPAPEPATPVTHAPIAKALRALSTASPAPPPARVSSSDPLKNGALIGFVSGAAAGALLGAYGCAAGSLLDGGDASCGGPMFLGAVVGGGIGAAIGVGVDALFDRAPQSGTSPGGRRKGLLLRVRF